MFPSLLWQINSVKLWEPVREGQVRHQIFDMQVQLAKKRKKLDPIGYGKIRGQKDLKSMKKGVKWIENQGNNPQNGGHHCGTFLPCPSMGVPTQGASYSAG